MSPKKEQVYKELQLRIITNELAPGELLNEKELMGHYKIGRTPLREILLQLQNENLIQMKPKYGTFVSQIDFQEVKEIIEIRKELEGLAGRLAAARIKPEQLEDLRSIIAQVEELQRNGPQTLANWTKLDFAFHSVLYQATGNKNLTEILQKLHNINARFWYHLKFDWEMYSSALNDFKIMVAALEKSDEKKAQDALINHIDVFVSNMKSHLL